MKINRDNYEIFAIDYIDGTLSKAEKALFESFLSENPDIKEEMKGLDETILEAGPVSSDLKEELYRNDLPSDEELEQMMVARLEKDLSSKEENQLLQWIKQYPDLKKNWSLIALTRLEAQNIPFNNKDLIRVAEYVDYQRDDHLMIGSLEGDLNKTQSEELKNRFRQNTDLEKEFEQLGKTVLEADASIRFEEKSSLKKSLVVPMIRRVGSAVAGIAAILAVVFLLNTDRASEGIAYKSFNENAGLITRVAQTDNKSESHNNTQWSTNQNQSIFTTTEYTGSQNQNATPKKRLNSDIIKLSRKESQPIFASTATDLKVVKGEVCYVPAANMPYDQEIEEAIAQAKRSKAKQYDDVLKYAEAKVKGKLWGDEEYPEEGYTAALADKAAEKISQTTALDVDIASEEDSQKGWSFALGKFKVERINN